MSAPATVPFTTPILGASADPIGEQVPILLLETATRLESHAEQNEIPTIQHQDTPLEAISLDNYTLRIKCVQYLACDITLDELDTKCNRVRALVRESFPADTVAAIFSRLEELDRFFTAVSRLSVNTSVLQDVILGFPIWPGNDGHTDLKWAAFNVAKSLVKYNQEKIDALHEECQALLRELGDAAKDERAEMLRDIAFGAWNMNYFFVLGTPMYMCFLPQ